MKDFLLNLVNFLNELLGVIFARADEIKDNPINQDAPTPPIMPQEASIVPTPTNPDVLLPDWSQRDIARHNVRVIADQEGLTEDQKNLMSQVIHCESNYNINCVHPNIVNGHVASTDYGICQWNDYYHGKEISPHDAQYDPEKAVRLMCKYVKQGLIKEWVCYQKSMYLMFSA